jgi:hypothetical protein
MKSPKQHLEEELAIADEMFSEAPEGSILRTFTHATLVAFQRAIHILAEWESEQPQYLIDGMTDDEILDRGMEGAPRDRLIMILDIGAEQWTETCWSDTRNWWRNAANPIAWREMPRAPKRSTSAERSTI